MEVLRAIAQDLVHAHAEGLPALRDLHERPPTSKYTRLTLIQGITAHDVYHAGQIQLLKRLCRG